MLLEVCCNSLESALNAEKAGADRIELCSELGVGGITPSYGLIKLVKQRLEIPIHVLLRPRSGHFTYSDTEFEVLLSNIEVCKEIGIDGIVSGALNANNLLDIHKTRQLVEKTKSFHFTFHRAFDWIPNQQKALEMLEEIGVDTILTSGAQLTAEKGLEHLKELNDWSTSVTIMPGSGVNFENVMNFKEAGFKAIHCSGTTFTNEVAIQDKISMNSQRHLVENEIAVTNDRIVRQIVQVIK
ncbi:copper homeostasis protein CutC [Croceitalea rosinachiae]|uniref:PF03932 family protein CutC n=1 Tax=Croceitalea rosinachiae TaxID=3075596 RepID=A0ABU3A697_9FLAO|nr:copper homeostasis protein CutC [Croceitalea sp. F388]MDT0605693.1 copper homeostasis protein CutC [Croceitalea sp. F388]